jgi:Ca2+-binding RTX toxin-like protein
MSIAFPISVTSDDVALTISENTLGVTMVEAMSDDASAVLNYTITGGDDAALFMIDRATGMLQLRAPLDFENPTNAATDSTEPYLVTVTVSDGSETHAINYAVSVSDSATFEGTNDNDVLSAADVDTTDAELYGYAGKDELNGGDGNDLLDGGLGADRMAGGMGDDLYVVDNVLDRVTEGSDEGNDTVMTGLRSYRLAENVENLVITNAEGRTASHTGYGNNLDNTLIGSSVKDYLYGFDGNDHLVGGGGNDWLDGGAGDDLLDGGTAADGVTTADRMSGGMGDDSYVVDDAGDKVIEYANHGNDTVYASIDYKLARNVESLVLVGSDDLNGTGNKLDNTLVGNAGANTLSGGLGDDTLDGGLGLDTLTGGKGADMFRFSTDFDSNADVITDFSRTQGDKIVLDMSIFTAFTSDGALDKTAFYAAKDADSAPDADVRIIYDKTSGALYYDADGNGTASDPVQFAQIGASDAATHTTLTYSDFMIVA